MTAASDDAGQAVATQGTKMEDRLDWQQAGTGS